ncbi:MAG: hypothetical protein ACJ74Q_15345 [Pyrinomonadaceae bacterium]
MKNPPQGKAKDYAPGEESFPGQAPRGIYRNGYAAGTAEAGPEHNPHTGKTQRIIWEAGRKRAAEDKEKEAGDEQ